VTVIMAWDWRKAEWGCVPQQRRIFHAYDVNHNAACAPAYGLVASCEEPNEGSEFCRDCMDVVRLTPEGRPAKNGSAEQGAVEELAAWRQRTEATHRQRLDAGGAACENDSGDDDEVRRRLTEDNGIRTSLADTAAELGIDLGALDGPRDDGSGDGEVQ